LPPRTLLPHLLNLLALIVLGYFTFTNFYVLYSKSVWLNASYESYEIKHEVKILVALCVILPVVLAIREKKYVWLMQSVVILLLVVNYKSDLLQKTIFINQPSSIQKTNWEIEEQISQNEGKLEEIIKEINEQSVDIANLSELKQKTAKGTFLIHDVVIKNKKVQSICIIPTTVRKHYHGYKIYYYPNKFDLTSFAIPPSKFGENLFVLNYRSYYFQDKWVIWVDGVTGG
jgi:hypothetical protein